MSNWLEAFSQIDPVYLNVYQAILRYLMPVLAAILLLRTARPLLSFRREPEIWAWLVLESGKRLAITHWESVIGRSKRSDVVIDIATVSRNHAVLTRYDDGTWMISDAHSKSGLWINGEQMDCRVLQEDDVITIGGVNMRLLTITRRQEITLAQLRTKGSRPMDNVANLFLLTLIQFLCCLSYLLGGNADHLRQILTGFAGIVACQWVLLLIYLLIRKGSFELETIAFFLCTMGMAAIAAVKPGECTKQLLALGLGLVLFLTVGILLRKLNWAKKLQVLAGILGIGLLVVTLVFGKEYHGAKNWLIIGGFSFQPSEISKVCFVFAGTAAMERVMNRKNLILFIAYTVAICACLAVMNDFGTALIFFVAFLLMAYMRSGSVGTIALACTSLGFAGVIALKIAPHAMRRFAAWRHIWEKPLTTGYQQTRALMCLVSGGLFGLGAGRGWMKNVFAADSDVVFASIGEEWGLIMCLLLVVSVIVPALFALRCAAVGRSSFYTIGACTAAGILVVQTVFNVLGTLDILPLTGVTMPFVSNGGSSMICAWGLLAFIKASDTRQDASFAVRQSKEGRLEDE